MKNTQKQSVISFQENLKKASSDDIRKVIALCVSELESRGIQTVKSDVAPAKAPKSKAVTAKAEPHYHVKGLDLWILYKDPKESGSYQFNRISKAIKLSATKDYHAKFSGDYDQKIWKWTFKSAEDLKAFQKAQKERG